MKCFVIFLIVGISGCAQVDATFDVFADISAKAADRSLTASEYGICTAATIGALRRKYPTTEAMAKWNNFCSRPPLDIEIIEVE